MWHSNSTRALINDIVEDRFKQELAEILFYLCITVFLYGYIVILGSVRSRTRNVFFKHTVMLAYTSSTVTVMMTMGPMRSAIWHHELFVAWAAVLIIVLSSSDSISAFNLTDIELRKKQNIIMATQMFYFVNLVPLNTAFFTGNWFYTLIIAILVVVLSFKIKERSLSFMLASRVSLARNCKLVADFMAYEHELSEPDEEIDAMNMRGYNYLVHGEDDKLVKVSPPLYQKKLQIDQVLTIHKVWQCTGSLLNSTNDPNNKLKDICLAYSLFKLINRRFSDYPFSESSQEKTWNLVRFGLLADEDDFDRPFRVIETELTFVFDLFYTQHAAIFAPGRFWFKIIEFISSGIGCLLVVRYTLLRFHPERGFITLQIKEINLDAIVTISVMVVVLFLEFVQLFFIIISNWTKVRLLSHYVQKPSWHNRCTELVIRFVCNMRLFKAWDGTLEQFSILECFDQKPNPLLYNCITAAFLDRPSIGHVGSTCVRLPKEVKRAIISTLKMNGKRLLNGEASLRRNGLERQLLWACQFETTTHVILVWHIATSLCEFGLSDSLSTEEREHYTVATTLSKYCAHLVACAPRFLPDHEYVSEFMMDQVIIEIREYLKGYKSKDLRLRRMMRHEESNDTILRRGTQLGQSLVEIVGNQLHGWKILAEFWAELMLFVAPSSNVMFHIEHLALGGQFITHLWALLSHAGILERDLNRPNA